jgi:DNA-binding PadR family transcriptional regulator
MHQEVVLAMLAEEPSHGYALRTRLGVVLEPLGQPLNEGQIYVTLTRLEKAGLVRAEAEETERPERKVYVLTPRGEDRVAEWLAEVSWPKPDLDEFHLKLMTAAAARLADPIGIIDDQRRALLRRLRDAQRAARDEAAGSDGALLLEGVVLRLRADLRWLEACETTWTNRRGSVPSAGPPRSETEPGSEPEPESEPVRGRPQL